jgi:hypothetical protein
MTGWNGQCQRGLVSDPEHLFRMNRLERFTAESGLLKRLWRNLFLKSAFPAGSTQARSRQP